MTRKTACTVLCAITALLFAACRNDYAEARAPDREEYIRLTFSRSETRAEIGGDGAGTFTEGDRIGLFIDNGTDICYRELTFTAGEWQPRLKRSEFGTGELTFSAHYPALDDAAEVPTRYAAPLPDDQSGEGLAAADLLFARTPLAAGEYRAALTFKHALHRLHVQLKSQDDKPTLRVRSVRQGCIDLLTGETELLGEEYSWIVPQTRSDGSCDAVIWPQPTAPYREQEGLLEITAAGKRVVYKAPETLDGAPFTAFEP